MPRPLFVLGIARSGTNLLARMLDRHPQVCVALDPLMPVFRSLRNAVILSALPAAERRGFTPNSPFQDFYFDPAGPAMLDALLDGDAGLPLPPEELARLQQSVPERAALESSELARRLAAMRGSTYAGLIADALRIIGQGKPEAQWVGCKEVWIFDFVPMLARAFPEARFYAIERDPRAIIASLLAMAERDSTQAAHTPSYMRHWRKSVALSRLFEADPRLRGRFRPVAYESLVADPLAEARRLCAELELDYDPAMLSLSERGWSGNSSYAAGKDIYASSVDEWRSRLPDDARRAVEYLCRPEMDLTPYRCDEPPAPKEEVARYLARAGEGAISWRSGPGDAAAELEGEVSRHRLLGAPGEPDAGQARRAFLFTDTFHSIQRATRA